jgi:hypothetical protein
MRRLTGSKCITRSTPGVEIGHFARHDTRYSDEPHVHYRPMVNDFLDARATKQ